MEAKRPSTVLGLLDVLAERFVGGHGTASCETLTAFSTGFSVALSSKGAIEPLRVSAIVLATPTEQAARLLAQLGG